MIVKETPHALAFLDVGPLADAHLLLIPKQHFARLDEMPADDLSQTTGLLPMLSRAVMQVSGANAYNVLQNNGQAAGQVVEHVHFHIIPRRQEDGLGYRWLSGKYESGSGEQLQQDLIRILASMA